MLDEEDEFEKRERPKVEDLDDVFARVGRELDEEDERKSQEESMKEEENDIQNSNKEENQQKFE